MKHGNSFSLNSTLNLSSENGNKIQNNIDINNNDGNGDCKNNIEGNIINIDNKINNNIDNNHNNNSNNDNINDNGITDNNNNAEIEILNKIINTDISSKNNENEQKLSTSTDPKECSSRNILIPERTFFLRKCIGDEEATKFFQTFLWFDPFNDVEVEVEDDEEHCRLVISSISQNSQKEIIVKEKIVRHSTNLPRNTSLTNINITANSKRKRNDDADINFKENFDQLFGEYEKDFFEGIEVSDKKDEMIGKNEYETHSGVVMNNKNNNNDDIMPVIKREKIEGGKSEDKQHNHITMKIEKVDNII